MMSLIYQYSPNNYKFIDTLIDHHIDFIVGGGWATFYHKARTQEQMIGSDIDVYISITEDNLSRLFNALNKLATYTNIAFRDETDFIMRFSRPSAHLPLDQAICATLFMVAPQEYIELAGKASFFEENSKSIQILSIENLIQKLELGIKMKAAFPDKQNKYKIDLNELLKIVSS
jgi:hypothetical protein